MFDAATAPAEAFQLDTDRAVPARVGRCLALLRTLIAYGINLADTLRQYVADPRLLPCFTHVAITLATTDLTLIFARITRALLHTAALEEGLRRLAARRQDLRDPERPPRPPRTPAKPHPRGKPAPRTHDPARSPSLDTPPTLEQIAAEDRRSPIGAVLVDVCIDVLQVQTDRATWNELRRHIFGHGGSLVAFISNRPCWQRPHDPAAVPLDVLLPVDKHGHPIITYPEWPAPPELPLPLREDRAAERIDGGRGPGADLHRRPATIRSLTTPCSPPNVNVSYIHMRAKWSALGINRPTPIRPGQPPRPASRHGAGRCLSTASSTPEPSGSG